MKQPMVLLICSWSVGSFFEAWGSLFVIFWLIFGRWVKLGDLGSIGGRFGLNCGDLGSIFGRFGVTFKGSAAARSD